MLYTAVVLGVQAEYSTVLAGMTKITFLIELLMIKNLNS